jgi:predicted DNA-binding transcriptional regulator AlpA
MTHKRLLRANEVCARYGGITTMTLWRWIHSPTLDFPKPIYISRRQFYDADELDAFDRRQLIKSISQRHHSDWRTARNARADIPRQLRGAL